MTGSGKASNGDTFLWKLFQRLRQRQFRLGVEDYYALRQAAQAGFGLSSRDELRDVCCSLWAKSIQEREILLALFDELELPEWNISQLDDSQSAQESETLQQDATSNSSLLEEVEEAPTTQAQSILPPISLDGIDLPKRSFVLVPQFPITSREIAQAWRRFRRPTRHGPLVELDIEATITQRSKSGVASPVILRAQRRNSARLFLLIDRQGSMTPFHSLVDEMCTVIQHSGNMESAIYYYHDLPVEGIDESVLDSLADQLFPNLDAILPQIEAVTDGYVYDDPGLLFPRSLKTVIQEQTTNTAVVVLSDAGAAHSNHDTLRLLETVAFLKALRTYTQKYIWLNPLPRRYWKNNTAEQIARYVPMFPLDRDGLYYAVNVLRGQPAVVEKPL